MRERKRISHFGQRIHNMPTVSAAAALDEMIAMRFRPVTLPGFTTTPTRRPPYSTEVRLRLQPHVHARIADAIEFTFSFYRKKNNNNK